MKRPVTKDQCRSSLEFGKAAEHLVCADLILSGYSCFLSDAGSPFDIVMEHSDRLWRVQVKATAILKRSSASLMSAAAYEFDLTRCGVPGSPIRKSSAKDFDFLALVAMDIWQIAYMRVDGELPNQIKLRAPGEPDCHHRYGCIDSYTLAAALSGPPIVGAPYIQPAPTNAVFSALSASDAPLTANELSEVVGRDTDWVNKRLRDMRRRGHIVVSGRHEGKHGRPQNQYAIPQPANDNEMELAA